jgi:hypothetical protein
MSENLQHAIANLVRKDSHNREQFQRSISRLVKNKPVELNNKKTLLSDADFAPQTVDDKFPPTGNVELDLELDQIRRQHARYLFTCKQLRKNPDIVICNNFDSLRAKVLTMSKGSGKAMANELTAIAQNIVGKLPTDPAFYNYSTSFRSLAKVQDGRAVGA